VYLQRKREPPKLDPGFCVGLTRRAELPRLGELKPRPGEQAADNLVIVEATEPRQRLQKIPNTPAVHLHHDLFDDRGQRRGNVVKELPEARSSQNQ
jgi:hypothetical protein